MLRTLTYSERVKPNQKTTKLWPQKVKNPSPPWKSKPLLIPIQFTTEIPHRYLIIFLQNEIPELKEPGTLQQIWKKSPTISSVGQWIIFRLPQSTKSFIAKYWILIAQEYLPRDDQPFISGFIVLMLSWWILISSLYYWYCINITVQSIFGRKSSADTNSDSVELWVLRFFFVLPEAVALPVGGNIINPPECDLKSSWTSKDASSFQPTIESP